MLTTMPNYFFYFLVETEFHHVGQTGLELLTLASLSAGIRIRTVRWVSYCTQWTVLIVDCFLFLKSISGSLLLI